MNHEAALAVKPYDYPAGPHAEPPVWSGVASLMPDAADPSTQPFTTIPQDQAAAKGREQDLDELQRRFEAGRQLGFEAGRKAEQETRAGRLQVEAVQYQTGIAGIVQKFDIAREEYLCEVEHEVVELALAVAARILRREAQMDPLLLTGAVRVALGQLAKTTRVQLHVPQQEFALWTEAIAHLPNLAVRPEVVPGEELHPGDCQVDCELGSVDLGLRAQLAEIERGFFDRPALTGQTDDTGAFAAASSTGGGRG